MPFAVSVLWLLLYVVCCKAACARLRVSCIVFVACASFVLMLCGVHMLKVFQGIPA
jgi:hypothetical protein